MLLFKKIDAYAQVLLIVAGVIFSIAIHDDESILSYFIVGGWQVLSALIHLFGFSSKPALKGRKWYLFMLLFVAISGLLTLVVSDLIIVYLLGLLFLSPLMAVWYCVICLLELKLWEHHESPAIT